MKKAVAMGDIAGMDLMGYIPLYPACIQQGSYYGNVIVSCVLRGLIDTLLFPVTNHHNIDSQSDLVTRNKTLKEDRSRRGRNTTAE